MSHLQYRSSHHNQFCILIIIYSSCYSPKMVSLSVLYLLVLVFSFEKKKIILNWVRLCMPFILKIIGLTHFCFNFATDKFLLVACFCMIWWEAASFTNYWGTAIPFFFFFLNFMEIRRVSRLILSCCNNFWTRKNLLKTQKGLNLWINIQLSHGNILSSWQFCNAFCIS